MRTFGVALAGALLFSGRLMGDAEAAEAFPAGGRIVATYDVAVAGFSLGELHLDARFEGPSYKMKGDGKFSLFLVKTYKSEGTAASTGRLRNQGPEPASFSVNYESGDKSEERRISFKGGDVKDFDIIPPKKAGKKRVPVTTQQLRDVLDPLSAAFLHMQSGEFGLRRHYARLRRPPQIRYRASAKAHRQSSERSAPRPHGAGASLRGQVRSGQRTQSPTTPPSNIYRRPIGSKRGSCACPRRLSMCLSGSACRPSSAAPR